MILFCPRKRNPWQARSVMERALLECALFAHVSADEISLALSEERNATNQFGVSIGAACSGDQAGPMMWPYMAQTYGVTCAICRARFSWQFGWAAHDLGHFCQLAIPRHKPIALRTDNRFVVMVPLCHECRFPLIKAGCSKGEISDGTYIAGLAALAADKRLLRRVEDNGHAGLRIDPLSTPDGADDNGNLWVTLDLVQA
jgi:hypothetical protein